MRGRDNHVLNLNKTLKQACVQDGEILMIGLLGQYLMFLILNNPKLTLMKSSSWTVPKCNGDNVGFCVQLFSMSINFK